MNSNSPLLVRKDKHLKINACVTPNRAIMKRKNDELEQQPPNKKMLLNSDSDSKFVKHNLLHRKSDECGTPKITSSNKYSANERLKRYRKILGEQSDDIVKVHQGLSSSTPNVCNTTESTSSSSPIQKRLLKAKASCTTYKGTSTVTSFNTVDVKKWSDSKNNKRILNSLEQRDNIVKVHQAQTTNICDMNESISSSTPIQNRLLKTKGSPIRSCEGTAYKRTFTNYNTSDVRKSSNGKNSKSDSLERKEKLVKVHQRLVTSTPNVCKTSEATSSSSPMQNRLLKAKSSCSSDSAAYKETSTNNIYNILRNNNNNNRTSDSLNSFPLVQNRLLKVEALTSDSPGTSILAANTTNIDDSTVTDRLHEDSFDMDWSPIEVEDVVSDIQKLRKEKAVLHANNEHKNINSSCSQSSIENNIYIVVDTNVFISHLNTVRDLINLNSSAEKFAIVVVPWMVIQELDFFKDGRAESNSLKNSARRAVKFINDQLSSKHTRLQGQTVQDALKQEATSSNSDDGILFCCMQLVQQSKVTILLSNDVNLRNKALINSISSYGTSDIASEVENILLGNGANKKSKGELIITAFTSLCVHIIDNEMRLAYGTVMNNLVSKQPWSLKQCLIYIKRFWQSVFSLIIPQRQFIKIIDDLIYFHTTHKEISNDEDIEEFTKLCLSTCVYFKNCLTKYNEQIQNCVDNIIEVAK